MSYYILPKINTELILDPCVHLSMDKIIIFISQSIVSYLTKTTDSLQNLLQVDSTYSFKTLNEIVYPYEYLFSHLPASNLSICKAKPTSRMYYDMIEIYNTLKLSECLPSKNMTALYYGYHGACVIDYMQYIRENFNDRNVLNEPIQDKRIGIVTPLNSGNINGLNEPRYTHVPNDIANACDYIYYELPDKTYADTNQYILGLLKAVKYMLMYQSSRGCMILKIGNTYYKPVIDILYIISSLYNKVYIMKPNTSNNIYDEKYLVCKTFTATLQKKNQYLDKIDKIYTICFREQHEINIQSIVKNEISSYFLNKMEECNIIMGQQQIDAYDQMINLVKNKNKSDKIEALRKHNIQKCIHWCEKYKMPCNRFADKINIFLPISAYDKTLVKDTDNDDIIFEEDEEDGGENTRVYISNNRIDDEEEVGRDYHINADLLHEIDFGD
jgi:hypothetical protein